MTPAAALAIGNAWLTLGVANLLLFLIVGGIWIAAFAFWIVKIVEVAQIPEPQYRAAHTDKALWVVIVVVGHVIGALIWQLAKRGDVLRAAAMVPATPAGWYAEPGTGLLRWWDGYRWTEFRHPTPPPTPH